MSQQEDIGKAIRDLKALYPSATTAERADIVFEHIHKYGSPPFVVTLNGSSPGK